MLILFEWTYQYKKKLFLFAVLAFGVFGFSTSQVNIGSKEIWNNGPYAIHFVLCMLSITALFAMTILCASAVLRDSEFRMQDIIYTTPVKKYQYLGARFSGLMIAGLAILLAAIIGMIMGNFLAPDGPLNILYYLEALCLIGIPNLLFSAACLFTIAILCRSVAAVYTGGVLLYILYFVASLLGNSPMMAGSSPTGTEGSLLSALADPYGFIPLLAQTKGWTEDEMNTITIIPDAHFMANRLCWIFVSLFLLAITYIRFSFTPRLRRVKAGKQTISPAPAIPYQPATIADHGYWNVLLESWRMGVKSIFKSVPFYIMIMLWIFVAGVEFYQTLMRGMFKMQLVPYTGEIAALLRSTNLLMLLLLYFAAEIVWRDKNARIHELIDSTAAPRRILFFSKCLVMVTIVVTIITANIVFSMLLQTSVGYTNYEPAIYATLYYYSGMPMIISGLLFIAIQQRSANKYIGMALSAVLLFLLLEGNTFGLKHPLWHFLTPFNLRYDALNGWGHYKTAFHWFMLFGFSLALLAAGIWKYAAGAVALLTAGFIICQIPPTDKNWGNVYHAKYQQYATLPQPDITAVKTVVELYPSEKRYTVQGTYLLLNRSRVAIPEIVAGADPSAEITAMSIPGAQLLENDPYFNMQRIKLNKPLQPGDSILFTFHIKVDRHAFLQYNPENSVQENSAYIELEKIIPYLGYEPSLGLTDEYEIIQDDSTLPYTWMDYETTIGTAADQTVITVGALEKEWLQNGRRYFHYRSERPIARMFALASGKFKVKKENGVEIYYYHEKNVPAILRSAHKSLDTYSRIFSPYQYKTLRLVEIPHYPGAGTAYPGVVFLQEKICFGSELSVLDYATSITAHEVAHQWWAYQLEPVGIPGSKVLTETLANYSEAIMTERLQGKEWLNNYHLIEHNVYISNKGNKETPLRDSRTEAYVHYQKGSIVMQAMIAEMGADTLNAALRKLLEAHAWPGTRATTSDLLSYFYAAATPYQSKLISRWWETMFLYDFSLVSARVKKLADGKYEVILDIKTNAPGEKLGVALYDANGKVLYEGHETQIVLKEKPATAEIDPYILRLEKNRGDNVIKTEER